MNKKVILIVEDEPDMSEMLKKHLESNNLDVVTAFDGIEGYEKYLEIQPDLVLLDIMIPKMNGYEVCRKIRREMEDSKTPILMLTAMGQDSDQIIGKVIGAQEYVAKPFELKELLAKINKLLI